ncbi:hypothetical protein Mal64_09700 [Pseudobythopirellula maris]|uniref:Cytochrome C n=1 Tax=Pseudobythopirellula maris TaxID=2527991 RepID=A0A5C5ZTN9_9BACT|nr:hypothetical protein [Pseudobythopirellula maris]TWT90576.1 hypothetical protein Mal64_09700 [Pseudobythopirellula maris]
MMTPRCLTIGLVFLLSGVGVRAAEFETVAPLADAVEHPVRVGPRLIVGGEPKDDAAFAALAAQGVKTVVSVDGARPQADLAAKHGLRYVHVPIGYDGLPESAQLSLARVAKEIDGSVFVHCHHGKHRGPAAAAIVARCQGLVDVEGAERLLNEAGTSHDYAGLWRDVTAFTPPPEGAKLPELVAAAEVDSLAAAMAMVDRAWDHLKLCEKSAWSAPAEHPDLVPSREAILIREGLHESVRALEGGDGGTDEALIAAMREAEMVAKELEKSLANGNAAVSNRLFATLATQCKECHAGYRN